MGLKNKVIIAISILSIGYSVPTYAAWQGPAEMLSGTWGANSDQFGIEYEDTNDHFPTQFIVSIDGGLIVRDIVNGRRKIYAANGTLVRIVKCTKNAAGEWNEECRIIGDYSQSRTLSDGNIWTGPEYLKQQGYTLYSPTGQLIRTSTERPLELGRVNEKSLGNKQYKFTITYDDRTYSLISDREYEAYTRDNARNIYAILPGLVDKFNHCGKQLGRLVLPESTTFRGGAKAGQEQYEFTHDEYGAPVVDIHGNVYTWKRTPSKYSILKWTWVDDPNAPANAPDAPEKLTIKIAPTGINLFWQAVPQDPGCVTGYELARATTSGGPFSVLANVAPGTADARGWIKYTDTTAEVGTTYYYKVRAAAGADYSSFSTEASGKR